MRPVKSITQARIAQEAGVSQAAVSAILSGSAQMTVSADTRSRVLGIAHEWGYVAKKSRSANGDSGLRGQSVLFVETEAPDRATNEEWLDAAYQTLMGKVLSSTGRCLRQHGIGLSVFHLGDSEKLIQWLAGTDIGGVLWHATETNSPLLHWVVSRFPTVFLNKDWPSPLPFDRVGVDHGKNITLAAEHLWDQGHRRIATFGHHESNSFYRRRIAAYRAFVKARDVRDYFEFQELSDDMDVAALEKVRSILDLWQQLGDEAPTALITSDVFALPLLREARSRGISIPRDLSLVGIDNTGPCSLVDPPLTSMEQPFDEICRQAVEMLIRRKGNPGEASHSVKISPRLVVRHSVERLREKSYSHSN